MAQNLASHRIWALLIGVNSDENAPLQGAIQDVELLAHYFRTTYPSADIQTMIGTQPMPVSSGSSESADALPTPANVLAKLRRIVTEAEYKDYVHVHFSGHGASPKGFSEYSNEDTGDLALVLCRGHPSTTNFLFGLDLAYLIKTMVEKGLVVTMTLDCCFAGSVVRSDENHGTIRSVSYDPEVVVPTHRVNSTISGYQETMRNAHMIRKWLIDPEGYAIIAACKPSEIAGEREFNGEVHGALSYLVWKALQTQPSYSTYQSFYQHVQSLFQSMYTRQTPVFYGSHSMPFFGSSGSPSDRASYESNLCSIGVFKCQGEYRLQVGAAHGVQSGDEFVACQSDGSDANSIRDTGSTIIARVTEVRGLNSDMLILGDASRASNIATGWRFRPLRHAGSANIPVRIETEEATTGTKAMSPQDHHLWTKSTSRNTKQEIHFSVERKENTYYLLDASRRIVLEEPTVSRQQAAIYASLERSLNHLATYKHFELISNHKPRKEFEDLFKVALYDRLGTSFSGTSPIESKQNERLTLLVENLGKQALYVSIFDLGPLYQVEDLCGADGFISLDGNGTVKRNLEMSIPQGWAGQSCKDVVKVFVTSRPTSFCQFWLPRITKNINTFEQEKIKDAENVRAHLDVANRGLREQEYDPLSGDWLAINFRIHTV